MNQVVVVSQELENENKEIEDWDVKQEDIQFSTDSGVFIEKFKNDDKEIKNEQSYISCTNMNQVIVSQELENENKEIKAEKIEDWDIKQEDIQFSTDSGVFIEKFENDDKEIKNEQSESIDIKLEDLHYEIDIKEETSIIDESQLDQDRTTQICEPSKYGTVGRSRSRDFRNYSVEAMDNALSAIQNDNLSVREASKRFGVPRGTLYDRINGRVQTGFKQMSRQEEDDLENWLTSMTKRGFPLKKADLLNSAEWIISASNRKTPFKNKKPGIKWYSLFLKRHPKIEDIVTKTRGPETKEHIQQWFRDLRLVLKQHDALDILDDPSRIFNGDETSFSSCSISGEVLAKDNEKETITAFLIFSADGKALPPMVVFPIIGSNKAIVDSIPSEWFSGRSESGWMTTEIFFKYLGDGLDKWIEDNNISRPVLLFVDGHKSHLSMELSQYCDSLGIILCALPPNITHVMQPSDVGIFESLKKNWKETVVKWQTQSENVNCNLTKVTFCSLLKTVLDDEKLPETIKGGFRKCGLYPFNSEAIEYFKYTQHTAEGLHTHIVSDEDNKEKISYEITKKNVEIAQHVLGKLQDIFLDRGITNINAIQKELETIKAGITENKETFNHSLAVLSKSEERSFPETSCTKAITDVPEKTRENSNKINILQNITLFKNNTKTPDIKTSIMQDITVSPKVNTDILRAQLVSPAPRKIVVPPVSSAKLRKLLQQKLHQHKEVENEQEKSRNFCLKRAAGKDASGMKKRPKKISKVTNQSTSSDKTGTGKIKEKCAICSDDLESDTEENDFKNIGCDQCPRWYHLKCTLFQGCNYLEIADSDFICTFCATTRNTE